MILLSLFTFLTILSQTQANLEARFCCQEGEKLTVRSLGKDEKVAECGDYDVGTDTLEGKEVWVGGDQGEYRVLRQLEVKQPTCRRGLQIVSVNVNDTNLQGNSTLPLFRSEIRLEGGSRPGEGNVIVNGESVCDDSWDDVDARVACRMLGYSDGRATTDSRFGNNPGGNYGMDNVECGGYEERLTDCYFDASDNCNEEEAAGVICREEGHNSNDQTSELTSDGSLKITTFTRNHNNTEFRPQGDFCLAVDSYSISTERQWTDLNGVQAVYCDACSNQVVCHYTRLLYQGISNSNGVLSGNSILSKGFAGITDSNGDKIVDLEEFQDQLREYIRLAFDVLDKDDDNSISEEFKAGKILTRYSFEFFETALVHLLDFFDTNKNNAIEQDDALFTFGLYVRDNNEDGVLTLSELIGRSLVSLPAPLYNLYIKMDKNKDERLTQYEATDFIKRTFDIIDSNEDCFIEEEEISYLLKDLNVAEDMQLAIQLILKKYLTLIKFMMEQFVKRADKDKDGRATLEEILNFDDFDFIESSIPMMSQLGSPGGAMNYLAHLGPWSRGREEYQVVAVWLNALQNLMERPEYSGDNLNTCPGYNDKEFTLPKIQAPVGEPCCSRIKLNATGSLTEDSVVSKFPGLYEYEALDGVNFVYKKNNVDQVLTNACGEPNELIGYGFVRDFNVCNWSLMEFTEGFTGSCITGPTSFTVRHYSENTDGNEWLTDNTVTAVCLD